MIVITGGAGFIGSTLAKTFHNEELLIIDCFKDIEQKKYLSDFFGARLISLKDCKPILEYFKKEIRYFYHFGANSSTDQISLNDAITSNIFWSQYYWDFCTKNQIPFIYASSAATYGNGSKGFSDQLTINELKKIKMNNIYGWSKMYFDIFVLNQEKIKKTPPVWYGLKFFNVYGVNEYHKKNQSSVVHSFLSQLKMSGKIKLFKSSNTKYIDGKQIRDFVSVNFCIRFIKILQKINFDDGLLNVGTGKPKTFISFAKDIMEAYKKKGELIFIEMPKNLKKHYQYYTKSENLKTRKIHNLIQDFNFKKDLKLIVSNIKKS